MTDTEKRDAVLQEFCEMAFSSHSGNEREERMAAEIVRLRDEIKRLHEDLSRANAQVHRQRAFANFAERTVFAAQEVTP